VKKCPRCQVVKPASEFTPDKTKADGLLSRCRDCDNAKSREYYARTKGATSRARYQNNRTTRLAQHRARRLANPEKARQQARDQYYRLDPVTRREKGRASYMKRHGGSEEWARMFAAQGGCCYLCLKPLPVDGTDVHVDHDHSCCPGTKSETRSCRYCRRGLTHQMCNQIWGLAREDPDMLRVMAEQGERVRAETLRRIASKPVQGDLGIAV
jgi:hypothetical protein